ncbi:MAG: amino acid permease [Bacteroidetes bacterium]|nr:amino acid permease [Bacteroidota bacterium]
MLVSGSMIGSGIFLVSAGMMRTLNSPILVLICWLLSGIITLFAALSYGELAAMIPEAGGQFVFIKKSFGNLLAFIYGWAVFMIIQTGVIAAVAVAFANYLSQLLPASLNLDLPIICFLGVSVTKTTLLAIGSIIFLSFLNSLGIKNGKFIQLSFTSSKIIALLVLILIGLLAGKEQSYFHVNFSSSTTFTNINIPFIITIGAAMIGPLFSSDAWNNVTFIAGDVKNPSRNIPLGLLIGVLLVSVLYLLANIAYFILLPAFGNEHGATVLERGIAFAKNDRVGSAALYAVLGNVAETVMAALIVVSTFGCNNGLIMAGARLFERMANDKLFFKTASKLNAKNVPANAIWLQAAWASVLCVSGSYNELLNYCTFASLIFYMITISSLFYFRIKHPQWERPYKAWGYPLIPVIYLIITLIICICLLIVSTKNTLIGLGIISLGVPIYFLFKKNEAIS